MASTANDKSLSPEANDKSSMGWISFGEVKKLVECFRDTYDGNKMGYKEITLVGAAEEAGMASTVNDSKSTPVEEGVASTAKNQSPAATKDTSSTPGGEGVASTPTKDKSEGVLAAATAIESPNYKSFGECPGLLRTPPECTQDSMEAQAGSSQKPSLSPEAESMERVAEAAKAAGIRGINFTDIINFTDFARARGRALNSPEPPGAEGAAAAEADPPIEPVAKRLKKAESDVVEL